MPNVVVWGHTFIPYRSREAIQADVQRVAQQIQHDLEGVQLPLFLCMLNGAFVFAADLLRAYCGPVEVEFVRYSSYSGLGSSGYTQELLGLRKPIAGRHVVVVEDIVDTGLTMAQLLVRLREAGAASVRIATMFFKPEAFKEHFQLDYVGQSIDNKFVIGYGLDYDGLGRNLPGLYILQQ